MIDSLENLSSGPLDEPERKPLDYVDPDKGADVVEPNQPGSDAIGPAPVLETPEEVEARLAEIAAELEEYRPKITDASGKVKNPDKGSDVTEE